MLLIGIDEAGYGPLLGPLVVAGSAFRLHGAGAESDDEDSFPRRLAQACAAAGPGLRVDDSKRVHRDGGVRALERAVLPFASRASSPAAAAGPARARDGLDDLLAGFGCDPAVCRSAPWYGAAAARFPLSFCTEDVEARGAALRSGLDEASVEFLGFRADVVPEDPLNARFDATGNKAEVLFATSADVADALLALALPGESVSVVFDRQGGRRRYLPQIQSRWPGLWGWTLRELPQSSAYRLDGGPGPLTLRFEVGADAASPQVGLASMAAKYLREAFMQLWNAWFAEICPGVPHTAGYTQDGRRWLDATRAARQAAGIPDAALVRRR